MKEDDKTLFQKDQIRREAGLGDSDVEFAADAAPVPFGRTVLPRGEHAEEEAARGNNLFTQSKAVGYAAIIFAVISLFQWPAPLGSTAILLGFFAFVQGSRFLGASAMILGLISLGGYILLTSNYV
ncbi:hypothetical protein [Paenibacillus thalictri]|uniref:DUF4190 domain-containing protein n=1 Tax=Paenibacillus thalictri TaxID=2527873 RepID=A0A4Q9DR66_9BACL|nr:hypothetical protein [Paenibacillus thalictri]TBL78111.1 hypothetical protein EYB31_14595 [Paenibacillus thalictri]